MHWEYFLQMFNIHHAMVMSHHLAYTETHLRELVQAACTAASVHSVLELDMQSNSNVAEEPSLTSLPVPSNPYQRILETAKIYVSDPFQFYKDITAKGYHNISTDYAQHIPSKWTLLQRIESNFFNLEMYAPPFNDIFGVFAVMIHTLEALLKENNLTPAQIATEYFRKHSNRISDFYVTCQDIIQSFNLSVPFPINGLQTKSFETNSALKDIFFVDVFQTFSPNYSLSDAIKDAYTKSGRFVAYTNVSKSILLSQFGLLPLLINRVYEQIRLWKQTPLFLLCARGNGACALHVLQFMLKMYCDVHLVDKQEFTVMQDLIDDSTRALNQSADDILKLSLFDITVKYKTLKNKGEYVKIPYIVNQMTNYNSDFNDIDIDACCDAVAYFFPLNIRYVHVKAAIDVKNKQIKGQYSLRYIQSSKHSATTIMIMNHNNHVYGFLHNHNETVGEPLNPEPEFYEDFSTFFDNTELGAAIERNVFF